MPWGAIESQGACRGRRRERVLVSTASSTRRPGGGRRRPCANAEHRLCRSLREAKAAETLTGLEAYKQKTKSCALKGLCLPHAVPEFHVLGLPGVTWEAIPWGGKIMGLKLKGLQMLSLPRSALRKTLWQAPHLSVSNAPWMLPLLGHHCLESLWK